jgi:hypothetical protein
MNSAAHFMRAFDGGFFPDIPFTLFMPVVTKAILYAAEAGTNEIRNGPQITQITRIFVPKVLLICEISVICGQSFLTC